MSLADSEYENVLERDPGNSAFAEFADLLRARYDYNRALRVCFAGLSANPGCLQGRLVLARIFYEQSFTPFAIRELLQINQESPENQAVQTLLAKLAPGTELSKPSAAMVEMAESALAEAEFSLDDIELIEEEAESN